MDPIHIKWLNRNSIRAYPLREDAVSPGSTGLPVPNDLLVDAYILAPDEEDGIYLSAVCVSERSGIISIALSSVRTGATLATATVVAGDSVTFIPVPVDPVQPGVVGYVCFGDFAAAPPVGFLGTTFFDNTHALESRALINTGTFPVTSMRAGSSSPPVSGVVKLLLRRGLQGAVTTGTDGDGEPLTYLTLSLRTPSDFAPACPDITEPSLCNNAVFSINEAVPDENGNIELEFVGFTHAEQAGHILQVLALISGEAHCTQMLLPDHEGRLPPMYLE